MRLHSSSFQNTVSVVGNFHQLHKLEVGGAPPVALYEINGCGDRSTIFFKQMHGGPRSFWLKNLEHSWFLGRAGSQRVFIMYLHMDDVFFLLTVGSVFYVFSIGQARLRVFLKI
jgi:hypothetical protein